jgi:hypothetical protein
LKESGEMKAKTSAILMSVFLVLICFNVFTVKGLSHDVAVTSVIPSQNSVNPGDPVTIYVLVENQGDYTETFEVTAYYGNGTLGGMHVWGDFWSMGDVNRDGRINDVDLDIWGRAYGTRPGDPNWNPDADLNQDLFVDIKDGCILNRNYGLVVVETQTIVDLPSGASTWLTYVWDTTGVAPGNYTINAYAISVPDESDGTDNNFKDDVVTIVAPPEYLMQELVETMETWNLPQGTESSLTSKVDASLNLLNMGNENGAIHKMMDFMDQVEAKRGKQLTNEQADYLISEAQRIIDLI